MEDLITVTTKRIDIGKCIYCGKIGVKLANEHIVPYGLHCDWVLLKASCLECAKVTSNIEGHVLNKTIKVIRTALNMKSRRPRAISFPLSIERDGKLYTEDVKIQDAWKVIPFPIYDVPGHYYGNDQITGIQVQDIGLVELDNMNHEIGQKHSSKIIGIPNIFYIDTEKNTCFLGPKYPGIEFARMLAKIGYCYALTKVKIEDFIEIYVLPSILGQKNDVGSWVGCDEKNPMISSANMAFSLKALIIKETKEILIRIKLLVLHKETPEYVVIVGCLKNTALNKALESINNQPS